MTDSIAMDPRITFGSHRPHSGKMRYLVEKWLDETGTWVLMARFHEDSDPDKRAAFCAALGGQIRVLDIEGDVELSRVTYE